MNQKFKRLRSQVDHKKQPIDPINEKSNKKTPKTTKQILFNNNPQQSIHLNSNQNHFTSNNVNFNTVTKHQNINHIQSKNTYSNVKLNRIQSQYIKPINSQSLPKTPKISKLNSNKIIVDSTKLKKPQQKNYQSKDYMQTQPKHKLSKKIQQINKNADFACQPLHEFVKKSLKTSKISSKSLTRQHSAFNNQPTIDSVYLKQKAKTKRNEPYSQKSEIKKVSKKGIDQIKMSHNMKNPSLKKTPSACSVKKYYILQKSKPDNKCEKNAIGLTTYRVSNPQQNQSLGGYRRSSGNIMKIYNSSTDLNNTTNSSDKQRQLLQRVQRTLEYYKMNLDEQIQKRRTLQMQNSILKEQLLKAIKINK